MIHFQISGHLALRWDVSQSPYVQLSNGRTAKPAGHKLPGLSKATLAVQGVLEVEVPPDSSYTLFPVFIQKTIPSGTWLVVPEVGRARLPRWAPTPRDTLQ